MNENTPFSSRRPRVTHVISGLGTGGTEMMCLRLARHWQGLFRQHVIAWTPTSRALESAFLDLRGCALNIGPEHDCSHFARWLWIRERLRNEAACDAMIIHCFGVHHLLATAAARSAGINKVVANAGNPPPASKAARRRWRAVLWASRILRCPVFSCSNAVNDELGKLGAGMPKGSAVLPNAVDIMEIASKANQARQTRQSTDPVIGMIARLDAIKDHATLIRAFAMLRRNVPGAKLWIIGDGALRAPLEAIAETSGTTNATRFFGNRTDIASLLGQMDIYAFSTTRDEGFGIALIEAMAAGVPIVASDVPACREVLADGEAGILVSAANPEAMAAAFETLLSDEIGSQQMVQRANTRVRNEYSIETYARRWEELLFGSAMHSSWAVQCAS